MTYPAQNRTVAASTNRLDLAAKRLAREAERNDRSAKRAEQDDDSPEIIAEVRARTAALSTAHCVTYAPKDWAAVAAPGPVEWPVRSNPNEAAARRALTAYRPGWIDRLFGFDQDKRRALVALVAEAASQDEAAFRAKRDAAQKHNAEVEFATRLLQLHVPSIQKALSDHTTFDKIGSVIDGVRLHVPERGRLIAIVAGLELAEMPHESVKVLGAGRAALRPLSRAELHEFHRNYVCSVALRVAAEVLSAAPVAAVEIVVECDLFDQETEETRRAGVLHAKVTHNGLAALILSKIDPVDIVTNAFEGRMDWTVNRDFAPIDTSELDLPVAA